MQIKLAQNGVAAVVDTAGGELVSFQDSQGQEYIWQGDPAYWTGKNPILFPIVGELKGGRVRIGGRWYAMARHGFARKSQFALKEQGNGFAALELTESPQTLAQYPFPFRLTVRHTLEEKGFCTSFLVENTGSEKMLFCLGGHTGIRCPLFQDEDFEDYQLVFEQPETARPYGIDAAGIAHREYARPYLEGGQVKPMRHGDYDKGVLIFDNLKSKRMDLIHQGAGHGVRFSFEGFPFFGTWQPEGRNAPFVCLEPWAGMAAHWDETGRFEDKPGAISLAPGQRYSAWYRLEIL